MILKDILNWVCENIHKKKKFLAFHVFFSIYNKCDFLQNRVFDP
jgi:hypothetical protein